QGLRGLLDTLAACGVPVDTKQHEPQATAWHVDGRGVHAPDGTTPANALAPARRIRRITMTESATGGRDQVVAEFLRNSREFVAMQREVMLGYLGSVPAALPVPMAVPVSAPTTVPVRVEPVAIPVAPEPVEERPADVVGSVLAVISDRTGFPPDMIDHDLDLEADLSIDSIKRTEIAGTLLTRLGLADEGAADLLVRERTVTGMVARLRGWLDPTPDPAPIGKAPHRFLEQLTTAAYGAADPDRVRGRTVAVLAPADQDELRRTIEARFSDAGANPILSVEADLVISLEPLADPTELCAPRLFEQLKAARGTFVSVALADTRSRAGLAGLFRAAALERTVPTRLVVAASVTDIDKILLDEVLSGDGPPVVHHLDSGRFTTTMVEEELGSIARSGAGPGSGELQALGLDSESVVVFLGGARGVAARTAVALAASGCRIELTGRTPWPMPTEDASLPEDEQAVREVLIGQGQGVREIDRRMRTIRAQREIGRTIEEIAVAGGQATYHSVDSRDEGAVRALIADVHGRHGRIDGVVHAAGVIEDRLLAEKHTESFRNVFDTKVSAACALLADADVRPSFIAFFGSISALLGNRGQTDYAAANDALDVLGRSWTGRALTVHWGPWAPAEEHGGMVTPELAREYERRKVALLDPDEATAAFLRELAYGSAPAVLYTASLW
ncbi:MAG TPA: SDR family NAD(P)-dependent oxidoreductase, partial [Pseudonocardiaceae bacterium]|nr:SDR family NAD(P)-dependent oxidoreductase [Pseudonocardiaceae bacterium]